MPSILISGANRGIGLEMTRQYADAGWRVFACCRTPAAAINLVEETAGEVMVHGLDVTDAVSVRSLAATLEGQAIDLLLNNAGVLDRSEIDLDGANVDDWPHAFAVNTQGPMRLALALLGNLDMGGRKQIFSITSHMGSIADGTTGHFAYRASKAALNMVMHTLAHELEPKGYTVAVFHPGWVKTDMGGPNAMIAVRESVTGLRQVFEGLTTDDNGRFLNWQGEEIPW